MKKTYSVEVDCANCARKMEEAAGKVPGVAALSINFMTQRMSVEFAEDAQEKPVMQAVRKTCRKVEPDFVIEL